MEQNKKPARKQFDETFKRSEVDLLGSSGKPVKQLSTFSGQAIHSSLGYKSPVDFENQLNQ